MSQPEPKTTTADATPAAADVVQTPAKRRRQSPKAMAIAHLASVLENPKASAARKDKAARLLLSHAPHKAGRQPPAAKGKGKKELQAVEASTAGADNKWAGLLQ